MAEFLSLLKVLLICGTVFFVVTLVLLSLPQSRLRCVGLEIGKWAMAALLLVMVPLPIDLLPDVLPPVTWIDDLGYLVAAVLFGKGALAEREKRQMYDAIELEDLRRKSEGS